MMDIPVIINNKNIITQLCSYIQNYLSKMIKNCNYFILTFTPTIFFQLLDILIYILLYTTS